jgi:hypothetical protein
MWEPHPEESWGIDEDEEAAELGGEVDGEDEADDEPEDEGDDEETDGEGEEGNTIQEKHHEKQQEAENVAGFWGTNKVRRAMGRETERRIGVKVGVVL